jgi:hypothetical protein
MARHRKLEPIRLEDLENNPVIQGLDKVLRFEIPHDPRLPCPANPANQQKLEVIGETPTRSLSETRTVEIIETHTVGEIEIPPVSIAGTHTVSRRRRNGRQGAGVWAE